MENSLLVKRVSTAVIEKTWYVLCTKSRTEKQVYTRLIQAGVEAFLPTYTTLRRWSDRRKKVEVPLFPSYVFVHITNKEYLSVLQTDGVYKYVSFEGVPAIVPQRDIDKLKLLMNGGAEMKTSIRKFCPGQKVRVAFGILKDLVGELIHHGSAKRLLVRIEGINQNLLVKIPANFLEGID
jgi:transcription antitermination factor NusG